MVRLLLRNESPLHRQGLTLIDTVSKQFTIFLKQAQKYAKAEAPLWVRKAQSK
ncbi:hypothetical protein M8312_03630 [Sphingomonas sp. KRR8]|jgi:hypothetical protein|uniref:hypothetical protein n=1 Tax=Sphingomonas sp. KRR8 TaxID=2942996 RepID=UPI0020222655|nr:hypothetical protein [Sphingomonas sp. KRR8]URD61613.1 hypothetical protein M8312_03630 [Sphingomonas sp. KRR8]